MSEDQMDMDNKALDLFAGENAELRRQLAEVQAWIADIQSGMYVNCVYCGHRYGPDPGTPVAMADVLKAHIEVCPKHPCSDLKRQLAQAQARITSLSAQLADELVDRQRAQSRIEKLRVYALVFLDSVEDDPRAAQFFDLRLLREVKEYVAGLKQPAPADPNAARLAWLLKHAHTVYHSPYTQGPIMVLSLEAIDVAIREEAESAASEAEGDAG